MWIDFLPLCLFSSVVRSSSLWFVFGTAECYSGSSSTCEAYGDTKLESGHRHTSQLPQTERSVSSKGSHASSKHKSVSHGSERRREIFAKVSSDLECLSSIPSETAKSEKLPLKAQQVYAELQEISNKLKVSWNVFSTNDTKCHAFVIVLTGP